MGLGACLGGEGEGELFAGWFSNDGLNLVDGVGGVLELGNIEALVLNLILTLDLSDCNGLGDTHLLWGGVGQLARLQLGLGDQGNSVGLGLVLLAAVLVLTTSILLLVTISVPSGATSGHLHCLGLLIISDLGGGAVSSHINSCILIGADLTVDNLVCLLANCEDLIKAVVVVHNHLDGKGDGGHLFSKGGNAHLGVDGGVGVPAVVLRGVPISWGISRG